MIIGRVVGFLVGDKGLGIGKERQLLPTSTFECHRLNWAISFLMSIDPMCVY